MANPDTSNIRQVMQAQGYVGPLPVVTPAQARRYRDAMEDHEREAGSIGALHMKSHLYFSWAWELTRSAPVVDYAT